MELTTSNFTWDGRAIILLDLDAFFASVEQLDHPQWRGKPVIVGGDAQRRGVVSTCSYEARAFGVRSAMPASVAARLCPDAIWAPSNFARYREMSNKVMEIMRSESPHLQQVSIDEAFLDVSPTRFSREDPVDVARRIQRRVSELGITCSIGLGTSKPVAKVASEQDKPQGLTVVFPGREAAFLSPLPTSALSGIGPVAQEALRVCGITTLGQVAEAPSDVLKRVFGKNADSFRLRCLGIDDDGVEDGGAAKSVSNEMSFAHDLTERSEIEAAIATVAAKMARRLRSKGQTCLAVVLKVRYADRSVRSSTADLVRPSDSEYDFIPELVKLLDGLWHEGQALRLVGAGAIHLSKEGDWQMSLFDEGGTSSSAEVARGLVDVTDAVRDRFGEDAVQFGRELRTHSNLTGTPAKDA